MFPLREVQTAMSALRRAGYLYYFMAHNNGAGPPLHTQIDDYTLTLVSNKVSRLYQDVEVDPNLFTLVSEALIEEEEEFR